MKIRSKEDVFIELIVSIILLVVFIITVYPFFYALIISFNNGIDAIRGGIFLWPRDFTTENYKAVFSSLRLLSAFFVSVLRTVIGTVTSVIFTGIVSYSLSHKELLFRKTYMNLIIFAMFFSGGLIPTFILFKNLHLLNSFWVYIIPYQFSVFNAIIMISFFREIPDAIKESVRIDGANELTIFFRIIVPISTPVFATIALFNGVFHWNSWFDSAFFVTDNKLKTLSFMLMDLIKQADMTRVMAATVSDYQRLDMQGSTTYTAETIRMATMMVVTIPIICIYPFLQKYFIKGIMLGSVKG